AIFYYDYIITTGNEINFFWRRSKGPRKSFWFFLNRYFSFFGNLVEIIVNFMTIPEALFSCETYNLFRQLFLVLNQVIVCALLTLRIYALYSRSFQILVCMACGAAGLLVAWSLFGQKHFASQPLAGTGCHVGLTQENAIRNPYNITIFRPFLTTSADIASAWEALMVFDTMIFSFILYRTWTTRQNHRIARVRIPLISLILRDGRLFDYPSINSISVTMMSRIMLNLHQNAANVGMYSTAQTTSTMQYSDSTHSGCEQTNGVELDTRGSDVFDRTPQNSPCRTRLTFSTSRSEVSLDV
ncbi:hypothetical protein BDQ17DRAFT_1267780, partial [Cyathus striatus]